MATAVPVRSSIARNALAIFSGQLGSWLLTLGAFVIVPRYLGPADTGIMGIGWMFAGLATTVAGLGMAPLITREVARDPEQARTWMATAIWVNGALGFMALFVTVVIALCMGYPSVVVWSVGLHGLLIPALLLSGVGAAVFQGLEVMRYSAVFNVSLRGGIFAAALVAVVGDLGLMGVMILTTCVPLAVAIAQLFVLQHVYRFRLWRFTWSKAVSLCRVSGPFFAIAVAWAIFHSVDVLVLSLLADDAAVGLYSAPARIFGTLLFIPTTIAMVTYPRFAAGFANAEAGATQLADEVLRLTVASGIGVTLGAIALSDDVLISLLGSDFQKAGPVIIIMALSIVPTGLGTVLAPMAFSSGRQASVAVIGAAAIPLRLALVVLLVSAFDARFDNPTMGAVAGFAIAEAAVAIAMLRFAPRGVFSMVSLTFYGRVALATVLSGTVLFVAAGSLGSLVAGILAGATYGGALIALRAYAATDILGFASAMFRRRTPPAPVSA